MSTQYKNDDLKILIRRSIVQSLITFCDKLIGVAETCTFLENLKKHTTHGLEKTALQPCVTLENPFCFMPN